MGSRWQGSRAKGTKDDANEKTNTSRPLHDGKWIKGYRGLKRF